MAIKPFIVAALALGLVACASPPPPADADGWHAVPLPGKRSTQYQWAVKDGRRVVAATADRSASMWRRRVHVDAERLGEVRFSWWVQDTLPGADIAAPGLSDAPAAVIFAFEGDLAKLSQRNRMMFELAETLSGERPPYATLMYVFGHDGAVPEQVVIHPRTDRVRKIVLDAGPGQTRRWREHRRDLAADFQLAFGEAPGALVSVAYMTDADNTQQQARAWYGPVEFGP
jgi:Protein of unknown function (DUF3047)